MMLACLGQQRARHTRLARWVIGIVAEGRQAASVCVGSVCVGVSVGKGRRPVVVGVVAWLVVVIACGHSF